MAPIAASSVAALPSSPRQGGTRWFAARAVMTSWLRSWRSRGPGNWSVHAASAWSGACWACGTWWSVLRRSGRSRLTR